MGGALLIAAQSGRALAQAARRAGLRPCVADLFGDEDTRTLAAASRVMPGWFGRGMVAGAVLDALEALASEAGETIGVVLGSGFEDDPALVAEIGRRHRLVGASAEAVAALKDPFAFAHLCARLGVPHPPVAAGPVDDPSRWLSKAVGGSGGGHVGPATGPLPEPGHYLQARVSGRPYALNVLAGRDGVQVLAVTAQWCAPSPSHPFRYGGALAYAAAEPHPLPASLIADVAAAAERIAGATGLRGLASADFLCDGAAWWLTEINPRPGATLDVLDRRPVPLLAAHVEACLSAGPPMHPGAPPVDAAASAICYARIDHAPVPAVAWPEHIRDRPAAGSTVRRDAPLCTVFATGADGRSARAALDARTGRLRMALNENTKDEEARV
ncbi:ATP-grasp domain-containing protein [Methylobacterium sp. J-076]|uniref:ATP-grasp domain-containing protein n=1 Tax=Methylobacterium sp. J-076 TaxID=2836655 RepID=UPI001FBAEAE6|nr:ATP-grasp domain-containing protein [Methylobacterium sp. J-076]MCJ2014115.1 ATP-grasp domain-containing protein [Methylobacterium sp. J-076]